MAGLDFSVLRSTPERRAAVFEIKLMFDEAHRLGELGDMRAYAHQVAAIQFQLAAIDPEANLPETQKSCRLLRSCTRDSDQDFLDEQLEFLARGLGFFEKRLRRGFGIEMEGSIGVEAGLVKFI